MARQAVIDAVKARLGDVFNGCPVLDQDAAAQGLADGSMYLVLQFPVANERQITIGAPGANVWREEGAFRLVLSVRTGDPLAPATMLIDQARAIFRGKQFSGVTTYAPSPAVQGDPQFVGGTRVELSSAVPYQSDFFA
ncbi:hypothetical protein [Bradyrhizobium sp. RD5-C2]|uniref:hypothetical protein n=1 Tax=Bradyrhizobium sp. RD5-C2 TaxID=244562 RepID=UPI001CC766E7|nr:hypothetical protein [Bradyrhizobium sp. RD5-C2]GIQ73190.1 hypothetical protein BraRD5C2_16280 [Bradyrhizobium sp. RD5-C2]